MSLLWAAALAIAAAAAERAPYPPERLASVRLTTEARLSPDGRRVAFATDVTGALELWAVDTDKGGWPVQLSSLGEQVSDLAFSPDGKWLVFASDHGGDERKALYRVPSDGGEVEPLTQAPTTGSEPAFSPDGRSLAFVSDPDRPFLFQIDVLDLATKKARRLTREPVNVVSPLWSRSGRLIAATRTPDDQAGDLLLIDVASGTVTAVPPPVAGGIAYAKDTSPDGRWWLLTARNAAGFMQLAVLPASGGSIRFIGSGQWDVEQARWSRAGIVYARNEGGRSALYRIAPPDLAGMLAGRPGRHVENVLPAEGVISGLDVDRAGRRVVVLREDSRRPADAWLIDLLTHKRRMVTRSALGGVEPESLAEAEPFDFKSFDGTKIEGFFFRPPVARLGSPPPAVVHVHGGPDYQAKDDFFPLRQALLEAGFAVIAPNYRGSTGYGKAFEDLDHKDWGGGDLKDVVEAVRQTAIRRKIDARRVGITGGSYGGYMTLTALTKTPEVWAAGVEAYGMPDLVQDYELTRSRFGTWYETEMGDPVKNAALYRERSPIHFLDRVRAPLMVFQGANDNNVPRAESLSVVERLKRRGAAVEYVEYPDEGHEFTKRANRIDYYKRTVDFFVRQMGTPGQKSPDVVSSTRPLPLAGEGGGEGSSVVEASTSTDLARAGSEALEHLRALIRLDTSNPPGNELAAARYLKDALDLEAIGSEIYVSTGQRASLIARLRGSGKKKPLLLMCHTDVVPVERERWSVDPFAAVVKDGYVYGRGAGDDKGMCAAELEVLSLLRRANAPLDRDVIFLAEADEESGSGERHIQWLLREHGAELDAEYGLNEGGDTLWDGKRISSIDLQCAEKQFLDLTLRASGPSGHSSVPISDSAANALSRALARLAAWEPRYEVSPLARGYLEASLGEAGPAAKSAVPRLAGSDWREAARAIDAESPELGALLRDTCAITMIKAGYKSNVIPAQAEAVVNCRLLPGRDPAAFVSELKAALREPSIQIDYEAPVFGSLPPMPVDNELAAAVRAAAALEAPGAPVRPSLAAWSTDSQELRARGVKMYGLDPPMTDEDGRRSHGDDERLPVDGLAAYVRLLHAVVLKLAGAGTP